jgi:hypothetical protein
MSRGKETGCTNAAQARTRRNVTPSEEQLSAANAIYQLLDDTTENGWFDPEAARSLMDSDLIKDALAADDTNLMMALGCLESSHGTTEMSQAWWYAAAQLGNPDAREPLDFGFLGRFYAGELVRCADELGLAATAVPSKQAFDHSVVGRETAQPECRWPHADEIAGFFGSGPADWRPVARDLMARYRAEVAENVAADAWHAQVAEAAARGDEDAAYELAGELGHAACGGLDLVQLEALVSKQAAAEDGYAQLVLSYLLLNRDAAASEELLRRAAINHVHQAQFLIADLWGVEDDCEWLAEYETTEGPETEGFDFEQLKAWLVKQVADRKAEKVGGALAGLLSS